MSRQKFRNERERTPRPARESTRRPKPRPPTEVFSDDTLMVINQPGAEDRAFVAEDAEVVESEAGTGLPHPTAYDVDPDISGAVVLVRDASVLEAMREQAATGGLQVRCLAIVRAHVSAESGVIERQVLERTTGSAILRIVDERGRAAVTTWRLVDRFIALALLECSTTPVNLHQIRVHLERAGLPLAVDRVYGGGRELRLSTFKAGYRPSAKHEERPLISRVSLHVAGVSFRHPKSGQEMSFEAPMPKDFRAAVHQLERFGRLPK